MDDHQVTDSLKKILMAGFGAVSSGVEKSQEVLDKLAEKGEGVYEQVAAAGKETAEKLRKAYEGSSIKDFFDKGIIFRREDLLTMAETDILWLQSQLTALAVSKAAGKTGSETAEPAEPAEPADDDNAEG